MKILVLHNKYRQTSGEDVAVDNEVKILEKYFTVKTFYTENSSSASSLITLSLNRNFSIESKIDKLINEFNPDVVYFHNTWFNLSNHLVNIVIKKNIKVLIKLHNFRFDCINGLHYLSSKPNKACHGCNKNGRIEGIKNKCYDDSTLKSILATNYSKSLSRLLKKDLTVLTLSNFHENYIKNSFKGRIRTKVLFNPTQDLNNDEFQDVNESEYAVYAGRLSEEKGVLDLVNCWVAVSDEINNLKLKIIGDGPLLEYFKNERFKNIEIVSRISHKETVKYISNAKFFVSATKLYEGHPNIINECIQNLIPIIMPQYGGIDSFFPKEYPFLFTQFDYKSLKDKIIEVYNSQNIETITQINKSYYNKNFSIEKYITEFRKILNES